MMPPKLLLPALLLLSPSVVLSKTVQNRWEGGERPGRIGATTHALRYDSIRQRLLAPLHEIAEASRAARGVCTDGVTGCDVDFQCKGCNTKSNNRGSPCASDADCQGGDDAKCSGSAFVGSGACSAAKDTMPLPTPPPTQVRKSRQPDIRTFEILTSEQIHTTLGYLAEEYHNFVTLTDAQTKYGLPAAGTEDDCPHDRAEEVAGCRNYILTIEDKLAHPQGSPSWSSLPEVFFVGAMHGTDRLGPTTLLEVAALLLEAASCESMSTSDADPDVAFTATICRETLSEKGVHALERRWLARLVTTRRIVMVPTANALGYFRNEKDEDGIDPIADFPFDVKEEDSHLCMRTVAGRTVNELFRKHMFQLGILFNSGGTTRAITYEWGATSYSGSISPDDEAQAEIAKGLSDIAGKFNDIPNYHQSARSDVSPSASGSRGEMEDWAYAGSWDPDRVVQCTPAEYGGYPTDKTSYDDSTLRTLSMQVECSDQNSPDDLGTTEDLLYVEGPGNGHIARNIKLSLLAIELVEPYVSIVGADGVPLTDDIVPLTDRTGRTCEKTKALLVPDDKDEIVVEWTVGGGFTVDSSYVYHFKWEDLPASIDGSTHPTDEEWQSLGDLVAAAQVTPSRGRTKWHKDAATPSKPTLHPFGSIFDAQIDISKYSPGDRIAVFALAQLDSGWTKDQPDNIKPVVPPQSHVVNARTNPDWRYESAEKVVQGRLTWYSIPLTLVVGSDQDDGTTMELSSRLNDVSSGSTDYDVDSGAGAESSGGMPAGRFMLTTAAACILALFLGAFYLRRRFSRMEDDSDSHLVQMDFNKNLSPYRYSVDAVQTKSMGKAKADVGRFEPDIADFLDVANVDSLNTPSKDVFGATSMGMGLMQRFETSLHSIFNSSADDLDFSHDHVVKVGKKDQESTSDLSGIVEESSVTSMDDSVQESAAAEKKQPSPKSGDCILVRGAGAPQLNGAYLRPHSDSRCYIKEGARWNGRSGFFNLAPFDAEGKWYLGFVPTNCEGGFSIYMFYEASMENDDKEAVPRDGWALASNPRTFDTQCEGVNPPPTCLTMFDSDE